MEISAHFRALPGRICRTIFVSGAAFSSEIIFKGERYDEKIKQMEGVCGGGRGGGIDGGLLRLCGQAG